MIRIYVMNTCPDCIYIKEQAKENDKYEFIEISESTRNLKMFLKLRDRNAVFEKYRRAGAIGIPCFELEDGTVTLIPEEAGLRSHRPEEGTACNIDGSGC